VIETRYVPVPLLLTEEASPTQRCLEICQLRPLLQHSSEAAHDYQITAGLARACRASPASTHSNSGSAHRSLGMMQCAGRTQCLRRRELVTTGCHQVEVEAEGQEEAHGERISEYFNRSEHMSTTSAASTAMDVTCWHRRVGLIRLLFLLPPSFRMLVLGPRHHTTDVWFARRAVIISSTSRCCALVSHTVPYRTAYRHSTGPYPDGETV
jgi:hypothetical protein